MKQRAAFVPTQRWLGGQPRPNAQLRFGAQSRPGALARPGGQLRFGVQPRFGGQLRFGVQPRFGAQPRPGAQLRFGAQPSLVAAAWLRALVWLGALLLASAPAAAAAPPSRDELLGRLAASSRATKGLAGEFTQRNRLKLFKQELRSQGRFFFRRPRQIRWEYLAPDPSTLVLDGQTATLRTPGAAPQVFDLERDATMRTIFDQLLLWIGPESLQAAQADYDLSVGGSAEQPVLQLVPRPKSPIARAFRRVELRLDGKSLLLRSILLVETNGDEKEISFTHLQRNPSLPADAFR